MAKPSTKQGGQDEEKSRGGRPRKEGKIPQVDMLGAIGYAKKAYDKDGLAVKSFKGMADAMEVGGFASRAFGELMDQYDLLTHDEDGGWQITDLGRRAVSGEKSAVIEVLCKNEIMRDLYVTLKDRKVGRDFVVDYIRRKRYAYNINPENVADRFLDSLKYLEGLSNEGGSLQQPIRLDSRTTIQNFLKLVQLQYALNPPNKTAISKLALEVSSLLEQDKESAVRTLGTSIKSHRDEEKILNVVVENALAIMRDKYSEILGSLEDIREVDQKN